MKLFQKKKNNKGFSLVELIVVVAIMAVLMAVLVPTLVRNVEKSRLQKDKSAISEVRQAVIDALADEKYASSEVSTTGASISSSGEFTIADLFVEDDAIANEVEDTIGQETVKLTSKLKNGGTVTITEFDTATGKVTFTVDATQDDTSTLTYNFYIDSTGEHSLDGSDSSDD